MLQNIGFSQFTGKTGDVRSLHYTWRDVILYAISIGANRHDLPYIYEQDKNFQVLQTFGLVPYLNAIMVEPRTREPNAPNEYVRAYVIEKLGYIPRCLHMGLELTIHDAIDPYEGTLIMEDKLERVYDRGEGKGVVARVQTEVYNSAGNPVYILKSNHFIDACGGFGGPGFESGSVNFPDREPDILAEEYLPDNLAVLYRLMGDTASIHIDEKFAKSQGNEAPIMHGLATYGFAVRMGIQKLFPYESYRITRLNVQMRAVTYPGQDVVFQGWKTEPGKVVYKLLDKNGKALLNNGIIEYSTD